MDKRNKIEPKDQSWEKALRDKLDDFEYPMGELPPFVLPSDEKNRSGLAPWWLVAASVAASLLLALLFPRKSEKEVILPAHHDSEISAQLSLSKGLQEDSTLLASNRQVPKATIEEKEVPKEETITIPIECNDGGVGEKEEKKYNDEQVQSDNYAVSEGIDKSTHIEPIPRVRKPRGATIAVHVFGVPEGGEHVETDAFMSYSPFSEMDNYVPGNKSYMLKEKLPIEVGITAVVPIAYKLSVESGLRYTLRRFEVTSSGTFMPEQYEMDVHQLGVPIGLQYEVARVNRLGINVSAGVTGNIPVAVAIRGNQIEEQKMNFSLDGYVTLGADWRVSNSIALSAAVGGAYDMTPLNKRLFEETSSRFRLKMNVGLKFRIE